MSKPMICIPKELTNIYPSGQLECSNCGSGLTVVYRNRGGVTCVSPLGYKFCPSCGFKIVWGKEQI